MRALIEALSGRPTVPFKSIPINGRFIANQWGDGKDSEWVKRDKTTATDAVTYEKLGGHPNRGWQGRTQFGMNDQVVPL
jgi:hypothetical protein